MVTLHEVITFLVSMQISISSLQTHNVNRCGRSRHLARKLSLRRKRSSPNVFEMAATETITSIILDRKSGSAGMPRPISYAVFCLKKKKRVVPELWKCATLCPNLYFRKSTGLTPTLLPRCATNRHRLCVRFFFFNDTATTEIYTLSLHDALPIAPRSLTLLDERAVVQLLVGLLE